MTTAIPRKRPRRVLGIQLNAVMLFGLVVTGSLILFAVLGPLLVDQSRGQVGASMPLLRPSAENWLGTDTQGRDVFTNLVLATPKTLFIGLLAGVIGIVVGTVLGLVSGFYGGWIDLVIRTATDVFITIPGIAILVVVATNVRTMDVTLMALIVSLLAWRFPARSIRAQTLSLRERPYLQVAQLNGVNGLELIIREVLPNLLPYIAASFVSAVSQSILTAIGLEALGLGPQDEYTLGMMLYWAQFYGAVLRGLYWWWMPPVVIIVLIFVGLLFTSAGIDELVNTRLRKRE
jgi:peptide/nickel transport system permease protein